MQNDEKKLLSLVNLVKGILAVLAAFGVISFATGNPGGLTTDTTTNTQTKTKIDVIPPAPSQTMVDTADPNAKADNVVPLTPKAQDVEETLAIGAAKGTNDLKAREKPSLPPLAGKITGPIAQLQPPFASDSLPGCRTRFFNTNWSARSNNATPSLFWLHYTAGPDVPNSRSDVDGLTAYGNKASAAVSWHINMDKDGNCDYNVPFRYKAWTEAGGNSTGLSIEVAGTGSPPYLRPGGYHELARIYLEIKRRYGIPLRLGGIRNCTPTRSGIVTHWMGGPCSGGHVDIKPFVIQQIIATLGKYVAQVQCPYSCKLRQRHKRTHDRLRKNHCTPKKHGYCDTLRSRNRVIHKAAKAHHVSLKGTF